MPSQKLVEPKGDIVFESDCDGEEGEEDNNPALSSPPPPSLSPDPIRVEKKRVIDSNNTYTIIKQTICTHQDMIGRYQ